MSVQRCPWVDLSKPDYVAYHDEEWGVPVRDDDRTLFEYLVLESAQAGLSWYTILRKRAGYRRAFAQFDPLKVAAFTDSDVDGLLADPGIVRHRQKIEATIANARALLRLQQEEGSFSEFLWRRVEGRPVINKPRTPADYPTRSPLSDGLSADLKKRGFRFLGTTTVYAFLQAVGVVNDHSEECFRQAELAYF